MRGIDAIDFSVAVRSCAGDISPYTGHIQDAGSTAGTTGEVDTRTARVHYGCGTAPFEQTKI